MDLDSATSFVSFNPNAKLTQGQKKQSLGQAIILKMAGVLYLSLVAECSLVLPVHVLVEIPAPIALRPPALFSISQC